MTVRATTRRAAFAGVASLLVAAPLAAQAPVPAELTREDALRIARASSPDYLQAVNDVAVSEARHRQALGGLLPTLGSSLSLRGSSSTTVTGTDDFGQPVELPQAVDYRGSSTSQGVGVDMVLFDGGAAWHRWRAAEHATRAAEAQTESSWLRTRTLVINAYDAVIQQDRNVALAGRLLASARERLDATVARLRLGVVDPVDVLGAEVEVARREQEVAQARGDSRKARLDLLAAMGVEGAPDFDPASELPPAFDPATLDAEALVVEALGSSPRMLQRRAALAAAERDETAARNQRWLPRVSGSLGFSRGMNLPNYSALSELNPQNRSLSFGLSASLPLFDGFQRGAAVVQADAAAEDARLQLRAERLGLEREVRSAMIDLENAWASLQLAERSADLSRQRVELTQEKYRLGGNVSFLDLQNVIDQAANAERQALQARFNFERARVNLEQLVGREVGR